MNSDQIDDRGVDGGEQKQRENNTNDDGENVTERSAERAAHKNLSHVTQHVVADALSAGCIHVAVYDLQSAERVHGEPEQSGKDADFDHDHQDGGVEVLTTDGRSSVLPGSSFITPVALAIASTPESARTMPTKPAQLRSKLPCNG